MIIFLILYLIFLIVFIGFNTYMYHRLWQMRIEGDLTSKALLVYGLVCGFIILISLVLLSFQDWSRPASSILGG